MNPHRIAAARDVVARLAAFETAIAQALSAGGDLVAVLPRARTEAGLSTIVGHQAISSMTSSLALIGNAHDELAKGHRVLGRLQESLGLPEVSLGDKEQGPQSDVIPMPFPMSARAA